MNSWDLLFQHSYEIAENAYLNEIKYNQDDPGPHGSLAIALCAQKKYKQALEHQMRAHNLSTARKPGSATYLDKVGALLWLLGQRQLAAEKLTSVVSGILDGSIGYSRDIAGGASEALLLWYMAVSNNDSVAKELAQSLFERLRSRSRLHLWPGHIVQYILGGIRAEELFRYVDSPRKHTPPEKRDLLRRRELVNVLFYIGVNMRNLGNESECRQFMERCGEIENPVLEAEWYLAVGENDLSAQK